MSKRRPRRRYSAEAKAGVLTALAQSAAANGGVPVWAAVARETGVARKTLRTWWAAEPHPPAVPAEPAEPAAAVKVEAEPEERESPVDRAKALLEADAETFRLSAIAELIRERDRATGDTARAQLTSGFLKLARELRPVDPVELDESQIDRDDYEVWLESEAQRLGDQDLEVILQVYADRHRSRLVLIAEDGRQAELIQGTWVVSE